MKFVFSPLAVALLLFTTTTWLFAESVPRMDKETLRSLMGSDHLVILDVRQDGDWKSSDFKIKNARRVDDEDLSSVMKLPKDSLIVLYCS